MEQVGKYIWKVDSDTSYGKTYLIDVTPGQDVSCTCTGYATTRNAVNAGKANRHPTMVLERMQPGFCRHIRQLIDWRGESLRKTTWVDRDAALHAQKKKVFDSLQEMMREMEEL